MGLLAFLSSLLHLHGMYFPHLHSLILYTRLTAPLRAGLCVVCPSLIHTPLPFLPYNWPTIPNQLLLHAFNIVQL